MRPEVPSESSCPNYENLSTFLSRLAGCNTMERRRDPYKNEHKQYVTSRQTTKATGLHFNLPGHSISDMKVTILEKVHSLDPLVRREREDLFIRKFNTKYKGLNKK